MLDAVQYIGPIGRGWTKPQLFRCTDGKKYVVKFKNNPLGKKTLSNEWIACRLASMLHLPVAECQVIYISEGLINLFPSLKELNLESGPHLGISYYEDAVETDNEKLISKCKNLNKASGMIAFDHWIHNWDRHNRNTSNLLIAQNHIVMIDHANCFDGPRWSVDSLNKNQNKSTVYWGQMYKRLVRYIDGKDPFHNDLKAIEALSKSDIKEAMEGIPKEWGLKRDEIHALTEYLNYRKSRVDRSIGKLRQHFPIWHSSQK